VLPKKKGFLPRSALIRGWLCACPTIFSLCVLAASGALAVTSANISGSSNPSTAEEVYAQLNGRVALILDGGKHPVDKLQLLLTVNRTKRCYYGKDPSLPGYPEGLEKGMISLSNSFLQLNLYPEQFTFNLFSLQFHGARLKTPDLAWNFRAHAPQIFFCSRYTRISKLRAVLVICS
jgi:hypothetical protein